MKLKDPEGIYIDPDDPTFSLVRGQEKPLPATIGRTLRDRLNGGGIVYVDEASTDPQAKETEPDPPVEEAEKAQAPKGSKKRK